MDDVADSLAQLARDLRATIGRHARAGAWSARGGASPPVGVPHDAEPVESSASVESGDSIDAAALVERSGSVESVSSSDGRVVAAPPAAIVPAVAEIGDDAPPTRTRLTL